MHPGSLSTLRAYARDLQSLVGLRLGGAVGLLGIGAALELASLLVLLRLLSALGLSGAADQAGVAGRLLPFAGWHPPLGTALTLFVLLKLFQLGLRHQTNLLSTEVEARFVAGLRTRFYRAIMEADWLFFTRQRSSDLTQMLLEEIPRIGLGAQQLLQLAGLGFIAAVQVALAFRLAPLFTGLVLLAGTALTLGVRWLRRHRPAFGVSGPGGRARLAAAITEHLAGMKIAKGYGRSGRHFTHFQSQLEAADTDLHRAQRQHGRQRMWIEGVTTVALGGFVYLATVVHPLSPVPLLMLGFIFSRLLAQAVQLQGNWQRFAASLASYAAMATQRARYTSAAEPPEPARLQRLPLARELRFDHVTFHYAPDRPAAVQEIALDLRARQVTALCGHSGAGKSTLADLALGLLRPSAGAILLDGQPLDGDRLHSWRQSIGYVPQETFLFHDTVRANLLWAHPTATEGELHAALQAAAADAFVGRLPHGLDTIVGDRGQRLSGGERQRLALALALLRQPALLVLDEATSSLDPQNERLVQDAIERLHGETTILLIAHRLSTVRAADRIVVLAGGRIVETGAWDELCARPDSAFRTLVAADARA